MLSTTVTDVSDRTLKVTCVRVTAKSLCIPCLKSPAACFFLCLAKLTFITQHAVTTSINALLKVAERENILLVKVL